MKIKKTQIKQKTITASSIYNLNKRACKNWYKFHFFKVQNQAENQKHSYFTKLITAWSTYHVHKLVCKIWYQADDKPGEHKHLGSDIDIPINAIISKSKNAIKIK